MFLPPPVARKARTQENVPLQLSAPVGGLNAVSSIMSMPPTDAVVMENWIPYPDRLQIRFGCSDHRTGSTEIVNRLYNYTSPAGAESLWATTDAGVFNVTSSGAWPAAAVSLTDGKTSGSIISTGASNYLTLVNGVDDARQYDGATWSTIAAFGAVNTNTLVAVETYRQRLYFIQENSMTLVYLAANAVSGASVTYNLGSVFRRGGYITALGTWTIDGGTGPDDHLVICTNQGELAVFAGTDPAVPASWSYKGTYFIGRPLGKKPFFKYGGDLLYLCENGLFPLSKALLVATIDRTQAISSKIGQIFNDAGQSYFSNEGWEIIALPDIPLVVVNVPGTTLRYQYAMHAQTGSWSIFSGWEAYSFARIGSTVYFGTADSVSVVGGSSDYGTNIVATMLQAYSTMGMGRNKKVELIRPIFEVNGSYSYTLGLAQDFQAIGQTNLINSGVGGSAALWGTGVWGTAVWTASTSVDRVYRNVPDYPSVWKALYLQVSSNSATVQYLGCDLLAKGYGSF